VWFVQALIVQVLLALVLQAQALRVQVRHPVFLPQIGTVVAWISGDKRLLQSAVMGRRV
jgi:hypothetical protein